MIPSERINAFLALIEGYRLCTLGHTAKLDSCFGEALLICSDRRNTPCKHCSTVPAYALHTHISHDFAKKHNIALNIKIEGTQIEVTWMKDLRTGHVEVEDSIFMEAYVRAWACYDAMGGAVEL